MKVNNLTESLYIHFPFCDSFCNYCDFYKERVGRELNFIDYEAELQRSWEELNRFYSHYKMQFAPLKLKTVYIGGGSPSLWGARGADFLQKFFKRNQIFLDENCEFTLEVNPRHLAVDETLLESWQALGANRFSVGIQSIDLTLMDLLGRKQDAEAVDTSLSILKKMGANFSIDLLLGIPTPKSYQRDLLGEVRKLLSLYTPSHISAYILTPKEGSYPNKLKKLIPCDEEIRREYLSLSSMLTGEDNAFIHYEVSNFAKLGFESQHNLQYWKGESVAALGRSASGLLVVKEDAVAYRYKWGQSFDFEKLGQEEIRLERFYLRLRTNLGLDRGNNDEAFTQLIEDWDKRSYILSSSPLLRLTPLGYLMLDSLMDEFFTKVKG